MGAILALGAVYVLWTNGPDGQGGFGPGTALPAPQAGALMGIIDAVKSGNVPLDKYVMGGTIGALLGAAPMAGLGVLIGLAMYLPFSITLGYGIGNPGANVYSQEKVPRSASISSFLWPPALSLEKRSWESVMQHSKSS